MLRFYGEIFVLQNLIRKCQYAQKLRYCAVQFEQKIEIERKFSQREGKKEYFFADKNTVSLMYRKKAQARV